MADDPQLSRIEHENGLVFGLKWSLVGFAIALCFLAGCSSLFDAGTPRYNTVQGPKRTPVMNPGGNGNTQPTTTAVQAPRQQQMAMPPVPQMPQQPYPQQPMVGYNAAPNNANIEQNAAQLFASHQPMNYSQPTYQQPQAAMPQMPQQPMTTPTLMPSNQAMPTANTSGIDAEIAALEREMAMSQAQRSAVTQQQQQEGWLPDLGLSDWFGGNSAPPPEAFQRQPMAVPGAAPTVNANGPMPPVINAPPAQSMTSGPVKQEAMNAVNVPLAPMVKRSVPTNVPSSLIPPSQRDGYLGSSRYSERRHVIPTRPYN